MHTQLLFIQLFKIISKIQIIIDQKLCDIKTIISTPNYHKFERM